MCIFSPLKSLKRAQSTLCNRELNPNGRPVRKPWTLTGLIVVRTRICLFPGLTIPHIGLQGEQLDSRVGAVKGCN